MREELLYKRLLKTVNKVKSMTTDEEVDDYYYSEDPDEIMIVRIDKNRYFSVEGKYGSLSKISSITIYYIRKEIAEDACTLRMWDKYDEEDIKAFVHTWL